MHGRARRLGPPHPLTDAVTDTVGHALAGHPEMGMGSAILLAGVLAVAARRFGWVLPAATDLRPRIPHRRRG